nr:copia protein [Tanacetum cinerariifolium]
KAEEESDQQYVLFPMLSSGSKNPQNTDGDDAFEEKEPEFEGKKPESKVNVSPSSSAQSKKHDDKTKREAKDKSLIESLTGYRNLSVEFEDFFDNNINEVNVTGTLVIVVGQNSPNSTNTFNATGPSNVVVSPTHGKSSLYQMDAMSAFLYETIEEEVYVCQPLGFKDPGHPDKDLCKAFEKLMKDKFQMSLMGELTFFLGIQVKHKKDGIFISQDKYVAEILRKFRLTDGKLGSTPIDIENPLLKDPDAEILRKFRLTEGKSASTPINTEKPLLKDPDGEDVDVHTYSSIKYALTVNPNIYVSYIKQFWTTVAVKKVNDITRLQALVNKKKVVVTEATIRDVLCLDNAEGVECLPNEEIFKVFANIRRVGKGFSGVETPLFGGMIVEQHVAREGDANENVEGVNAGDATKGDVSAANDEVPTTDEEPSIPSPTPSTPPQQPSQYIPSISLVQPTPPQSPQKLERRNKVKVLKLRRLQKVGTGQRIETSDDTVMDDVSNQGRMITEIDQDADVVLEEIKDVADDIVKDDQDADVEESAHDQGRQAESQAEIYKIDLEHANKVLSMPEDESKPAEVQEVVDVVTTAKIIVEVVTTASITITAADV